MPKLGRSVRFSINPFLPTDGLGFNSYAGKPAGDGLAPFFELGVELDGQTDPVTGLIVNVSDIDKAARQFAVPIFAQRIREEFRAGRHVEISGLVELLSAVWVKLCDKFGSAHLTNIALKVNPFRQIGIKEMKGETVYFSEKFEFAATHILWNEQFSKEKNLELFGKCANPTGHGHNYIVEVTVKVAEGARDFAAAEFERAVDEQLIRVVDHKNLNADVPEFAKIIPTVENIAVFAWNELAGKFANADLHCVTVWETDRTYCSYCGPNSSK